MTIEQLAAEVERVHTSKRDFVLQTGSIDMKVLENEPCLEIEADKGREVFSLNPRCQDQLAGHCDIPLKYARRMYSDAPELYAQNVGHWLHDQPGSERMLRTIDGKARAFLSGRYRRLDNYDLLRYLLPTLTEYRNGHGPDSMRIESCHVDDSKLYLKAVFPNITQQVAYQTFKDRGSVTPGRHEFKRDEDGWDKICSGVVISNSEDGGGSVSIQPMFFRLVCNNGAIMEGFGQRKNHVGRLQQSDEDGKARELVIYSEETLEADDRAFWLKCRDTLKSVMDEALFGRMIDEINRATGKVIEGRPVEAVRVLANKTGLNEDEYKSVLDAFVSEGASTLWDLVNAVTYTAQQVDSYDRATELERLGGTLLRVSDADWREIATAK